jgi:hypothetical protein
MASPSAPSISSSSSSDTSSRRRALHFDAESMAASVPSRPIVTRPGRARGHLHRLDPYSISITHSSNTRGRSSLSDAFGDSTSITSGSSSSSSDLSSLSSSSSSPSFLRTSVTPLSSSQSTSRAHSETTKKNKARSVTWSKAINAGIASGSTGVGIGSINHHHPLKQDVLPTTTSSRGLTMPNLNAIARQRGLSAAVQYTIKVQGRKISSALKKRSNVHFGPFQKALVVALPFLLVLLGPASTPGLKHVSKKLDVLTQGPEFKWVPGRTLQSRGCVLNMFIEKQDPDEFNPDYKEIKPGEKNKDGTLKVPGPPKLEKGTYRTKGQVEVITRFISSVADSFRPNIGVQQHLVFTGSRDGGHLAEEAHKLWPPRGLYRTKLYVISDHENAPTIQLRDHSDRALQYGPLDAIERRFQNHIKSEHIHIFDINGQKAGLVSNQYDDDDVAIMVEEEMFHMEDDTFGADVTAIDDDVATDNGHLNNIETTGSDYFSLKKLLDPYLEREKSDHNLFDISSSRGRNITQIKHAIPYFHVDGTHAAHQFEILQSARPLLQDGTISIIGVENSRDMDVNDLIDFFHSVGFKTFLLGKRQVMRIDHLCPEILADLMSHPFINPPKRGVVRSTLEQLKFVKPGIHAHITHPHQGSHLLFPAFFVGFPRGRASQEEMTIQHMYDLFGGAGGGGQIATANDRKAPDKKKKKS